MKINGTYQRMTVDGDTVGNEVKSYFSNKLAYCLTFPDVKCTDEENESDFDKWTKRIGQIHKISYKGRLFVRAKHMILTKVILQSEMDNVVKMTLVFKSF